MEAEVLTKSKSNNKQIPKDGIVFPGQDTEGLAKSWTEIKILLNYFVN